MSVPPSFMQQLTSGLSNSIYSPLMGIAAGLFNAGGASRLPVSTGQAIGQGMEGGQQFNQAGLQYQLQKLPLEQMQMMMDYYKNQGAQNAQSDATQQQQQQQDTGGNLTVSTPTNVVDQGLNSSPYGGAFQNITPGITSAQPAAAQPQIQPTPQNPWGDPQLQNLNMLAAMTRSPQIQAQAQNRFDLLTKYSPQLQGQIEGAKSLATLGPTAIEDAIRYGVGPKTLSPTEGMYLPLNDPNNRIAQLFNNVTSPFLGGGQQPSMGVNNGVSTAAAPQSSPSSTQPMAYSNISPFIPPRMTPGQQASQVGGGTQMAKESTTELTNSIAAGNQARQQVASLASLEGALNTLNSGPSREATLSLQQGLGATAKFLGLQTPNADTLTNAAIARKTIVNFVTTATRTMGAREPVQMMKFIQSGMQSLGNTPQANQAITGLMRGLAEYNIAQSNAAQSWASDPSNPTGSGFIPGKGSFQGYWQKNSDPGAYIFASLPSFEQANILKAAQGNATLAAELNRFGRSMKWAKANGAWIDQQGPQ